MTFNKVSMLHLEKYEIEQKLLKLYTILVIIEFIYSIKIYFLRNS